MKNNCTECNGTGVQTDENGIVYDDVCPECQGFDENGIVYQE